MRSGKGRDLGTSLISNPPYNMRWEPPELAGFLPQYAGWPIPPRSNANFAFVLSGLNMIDEKAVFLLPNGVLTSGTVEEQEIRGQLVEDNLISAIIMLPDNMFVSTSIPTCLLVLDKHKQTTKIMMLDMREAYETETRDQNGQFGGNSYTGRTYHKEFKVLSTDGMKAAIDAINGLKDLTGFSRAVMPDEVRKQDYVLTPARYIEQECTEEHHRPYGDITADYNRVIVQKNAIQIKMNRTAAKRLGFDCMDVEHPDLSESFEIVGQKVEREKNITFSADDGIMIRISTKDGIHPLIMNFLSHWKQMIMYLNSEENRYLAEFRDALLPELMSGKINIDNK